MKKQRKLKYTKKTPDDTLHNMQHTPAQLRLAPALNEEAEKTEVHQENPWWHTPQNATYTSRDWDLHLHSTIGGRSLLGKLTW